MKLIKLTQRKFAQVDDEDFEELNKYKWYAAKDSNTFYAERNSPKTTPIGRKYSHTQMHRVIMNVPRGMEGDHIDGDGLNNQKGNLRVATRQENRRNQTNINKNNSLGVSGVRWVKRCRKFQVQITVDWKIIHLGYFFCLEKAKKARREAELKYFGEFARKQA